MLYFLQTFTRLTLKIGEFFFQFRGVVRLKFDPFYNECDTSISKQTWRFFFLSYFFLLVPVVQNTTELSARKPCYFDVYYSPSNENPLIPGGNKLIWRTDFSMEYTYLTATGHTAKKLSSSAFAFPKALKWKLEYTLPSIHGVLTNVSCYLFVIRFKVVKSPDLFPWFS